MGFKSILERFILIIDLNENNQSINISEVSNIDTSHTLNDYMILIDFKDFSSKDICYKDLSNRDNDFKELDEAYKNIKGLNVDDEVKNEGAGLWE